MRFYELFTHYNTLFNPSDTVIKCFSRCTYINIAISVITSKFGVIFVLVTDDFYCISSHKGDATKIQACEDVEKLLNQNYH